MESDQGKIFIGGISWETTVEKLNEYFGQYGDVSEAVVMRDKVTGRPRGFGFVVFSDPNVVDRVLQDTHTIDARTVDAKRAMSREEQQSSARSGNFGSSRNLGNVGNIKTKKVFVGGLPPTLTEEGFRQYFEAYGSVTDLVIMYDQNTQRPRGFGFVSFDSEEAVDRVLHKTFHDLHGKQVEVKRAMPKDANIGGGTRSIYGGLGAVNGGYQGYGAYGGNPIAYDGRMDSSRYMQHLKTGNYSPYRTGYVVPSFGYGPANNSIGFGGYGSYGGVNTGYGGASGVPYGNPNVSSTGYASRSPVISRNQWNQSPSGFGNMGIGNTGYGAPGSAPAGQSPGGPTRYGIQSYGYGGFEGSDGGFGGRPGSVSNSGNNGQSGELSVNRRYTGNGYTEMNGNPGYINSTWKSGSSQPAENFGTPQANGPHGGQVGYGGGYGSQANQMQQQ